VALISGLGAISSMYALLGSRAGLQLAM